MVVISRWMEAFFNSLWAWLLTGIFCYLLYYSLHEKYFIMVGLILTMVYVLGTILLINDKTKTIDDPQEGE